MAAGVPIIATPVGGIPDFLFNKRTGLFCKVKQPQNLAEQIKLLLENQKLYFDIKNNALQLVQEKYDWHDISQQMNKLFNKLIQSN